MAETATDENVTGPPRIIDVGLRLAGFSALWVALARGQIVDSWYIGLPAVVLAVVASLRLSTPARARIHVRGLLKFVPLFLWRSLVGGIDVALRAIRPSMPLAPDLVDYELRLDVDSAATVFFVEVISLLPGTLCAQILGDRLEVHVVDRDLALVEELGAVEEAIAALFGQTIDTSGPAETP
jgi:multicomponent Na+:H+ antiporter subunit E